jgi:signal transduction histidine kinase
VVPVLAIVGLAAVRLYDSGQRAISAQLISSLSTIATDVSDATHQLQRERMAAAQFLAGPQVSPDAFNRQAKATDAATNRYSVDRAQLSGLPAGVQSRLSRIDQQLTTMDSVRQQVLARQNNISPPEAMLRYGVIIDDMIAYPGELSQLAGDTALADSLRAVAAFVEAKAAVAQEQAVGYVALLSKGVDAEEFNAFVATLTAQQSALAIFEKTASATQRSLVDSTITGDAVDLAGRVAQEVGRSTPILARVSATDLASALSGVLDLMRWAELRLDAQLLQNAQAQQASVLREVVLESVLVVVTLAIAIALAFMLARSMARSLSRLREGALAVAGHDLPEAVARLRDVRDIGENSPDEIARQVRDPIAIDSRDEIGQVAEAFNVVHREAVRVAAEQAALRTSVSAMFLNLARRSQALVDRMIGELDQIERGEEDPKRLSQLFQLDHLATRMRRNDENLLVLAGADSTAPRREDALLADVLRAAQSEVEQYNRIEFGTIDPDVSVASHAVNDVVRLVAELFDNATRFSPPESTVVGDGRRIGDYVLVQIEDRGLGMSPDQMRVLNERLAEAPSVDVAAFRMMGLAVVAKLADRYRIKVELRPNPDGGTITNVTLPASILILPRLRGREPVISRPRSPLAVERGPSTNPPGWPMPQLPGLATTGAAGAPASVITASRDNFEVPVAAVEARPDWVTAKPAVDALGYPTGAQPRVAADETAELPIFQAMDAVWFRSHGHSATEIWPTVPATAAAQATTSAPSSASHSHTTGPAQPTSVPPQPHAAPYVPPAAVPPPVPPVNHGVTTPTVPRQRSGSDEGSWRTAADDGWRAAAAAAAPEVAGTTRSGLPKRVPSAQLVPGGVETNGTKTRTRRTPDEVRGLLSAYHRGVQRGRAGEPAPSVVPRPTNEETH